MAIPSVSFAQSPTNPGTTGSNGTQSTGITYECVQKGAGPGGTDLYGNCTFTDLILAVEKFFRVAIPLAIGFSVVIIAYVGFEYMASGGSPAARSKANDRLVKVAIGIFFMLAAWVIVNMILNALTCKSSDANCTPVPRLLGK